MEGTSERSKHTKYIELVCELSNQKGIKREDEHQPEKVFESRCIFRLRFYMVHTSSRAVNLVTFYILKSKNKNSNFLERRMACFNNSKERSDCLFVCLFVFLYVGLTIPTGVQSSLVVYTTKETKLSVAYQRNKAVRRQKPS